MKRFCPLLSCCKRKMFFSLPLLVLFFMIFSLSFVSCEKKSKTDNPPFSENEENFSVTLVNFNIIDEEIILAFYLQNNSSNDIILPENEFYSLDGDVYVNPEYVKFYSLDKKEIPFKKNFSASKADKKSISLDSGKKIIFKLKGAQNYFDFPENDYYFLSLYEGSFGKSNIVKSHRNQKKWLNIHQGIYSADKKYFCYSKRAFSDGEGLFYCVDQDNAEELEIKVPPVRKDGRKENLYVSFAKNDDKIKVFLNSDMTNIATYDFDPERKKLFHPEEVTYLPPLEEKLNENYYGQDLDFFTPDYCVKDEEEAKKLALFYAVNIYGKYMEKADFTVKKEGDIYFARGTFSVKWGTPNPNAVFEKIDSKTGQLLGIVMMRKY